MKLLIVTSQKELSSNRVIEEAKKKKIETSKIFYGDNLNSKKLQEFDFCMIRDAYCIGKDFPDFLRNILASFNSHRLLDHEMYKKHPPYEGKQLQHPQDKLFQHTLYGKVVNMPKFWYYNAFDEVNIKSFPIIAKKRIGERCKEVFILQTKKEIKKFFHMRNINDYFFEEFVKIKKDIRILLLNHKIIGAVRRRVRFKDNQGYKGIGVKVAERYEVPKEMSKKAIIVSKILGSEFCGIDFVIDKNDKFYLIECNISPWFISAERILGINIAKRLVEFICEKQQH